MRKRLAGCILVIVLMGLAPLLAGAAAEAPDPEGLERRVQRELAMLPFYTVFDNLEVRVEGAQVTLLGQVSRPGLRQEAERAVKLVEGVQEVENRIQILPRSASDDRIRLAIYRAINARDQESPCADRAGGTIRILVADGAVTLTGCVENESSRARAELLASHVSGVAAVDNSLVVSSPATPGANLAATR